MPTATRAGGLSAARASGSTTRRRRAASCGVTRSVATEGADLGAREEPEPSETGPSAQPASMSVATPRLMRVVCALRIWILLTFQFDGRLVRHTQKGARRVPPRPANLHETVAS